MTVEFDDSSWKKALYVMGSDFDWKKICMLLAQTDPETLYDLAMTSLMLEDHLAVYEKDKEAASLEGRIVTIMKGKKDKIAAIKEYRAVMGTGLKESKEAVEAIMEKYRID